MSPQDNYCIQVLVLTHHEGKVNCIILFYIIFFDFSRTKLNGTRFDYQYFWLLHERSMNCCLLCLCTKYDDIFNTVFKALKFFKLSS
jgi:hypothetical protein